MSKDTWNNNAIHSQWGWGNGACLPTQEYVTNFYNRTLDAINRYQPDLIYFDVTVLPFYPISDAGLKIAAHFYNSTKKENLLKQEKKGSNLQTSAVLFGKILSDEQKEAMVWDVERGAPNKIMDRPWQCCNCIGEWHYKTSIYEKGTYKSASTVVKLLVDIVSKNGNMLLNVPLRSDGTFDEKEEAILKEFGAWMKVNKESIIGTRPWKVFGEGPIASSDIKIKAQGFNDGAYAKAGADEIRFTQTNKYIYATILEWPENMTISIKSLSDEKIKSIELIGYGKVQFSRKADNITVTLPQKVNDIAPVLKIHKYSN